MSDSKEEKEKFTLFREVARSAFHFLLPPVATLVSAGIALYHWKNLETEIEDLNLKKSKLADFQTEKLEAIKNRISRNEKLKEPLRRKFFKELVVTLGVLAPTITIAILMKEFPEFLTLGGFDGFSESHNLSKLTDIKHLDGIVTAYALFYILMPIIIKTLGSYVMAKYRVYELGKNLHHTGKLGDLIFQERSGLRSLQEVQEKIKNGELKYEDLKEDQKSQLKKVNIEKQYALLGEMEDLLNMSRSPFDHHNLAYGFFGKIGKKPESNESNQKKEIPMLKRTEDGETRRNLLEEKAAEDEKEKQGGRDLTEPRPLGSV